LFLSGVKDCQLFVAFYTNWGTSTSMDVPLLLCRSLGPGLHMTLKCLCKRIIRSSTATDTEQEQDTSHMELRGPILPCAIRDLTCTVASHLLLDKRMQLTAATTEEETALCGSHYLVLHPRPHEGEENTVVVRSSTTKHNSSSSSEAWHESNGSLFFNGVTETTTATTTEPKVLQECN